MAARVFDTYMPGSVEPLISFINSLSDGRILCLAILVSSYHKQVASSPTRPYFLASSPDPFPAFQYCILKALKCWEHSLQVYGFASINFILNSEHKYWEN